VNIIDNTAVAHDVASTTECLRFPSFKQTSFLTFQFGNAAAVSGQQYVIVNAVLSDSMGKVVASSDSERWSIAQGNVQVRKLFFYDLNKVQCDIMPWYRIKLNVYFDKTQYPTVISSLDPIGTATIRLEGEDAGINDWTMTVLGQQGEYAIFPTKDGDDRFQPLLAVGALNMLYHSFKTGANCGFNPFVYGYSIVLPDLKQMFSNHRVDLAFEATFGGQWDKFAAVAGIGIMAEASTRAKTVLGIPIMLQLNFPL